jgi:osmotically-inducible protein OsmY
MSNSESHPSTGATLSMWHPHAATDQRNLNAGECIPDPASLEAVVARALRVTGHTALRCVVVEVCPSAVVLQGCVPTYYEKQLAQATAQQVAANHSVVNEIEVVCGR